MPSVRSSTSNSTPDPHACAARMALGMTTWPLLDILVSCIVAALMQDISNRHTDRQWLDFLRHLNREAPEGLCLHLIVDSHATHKHAKVRSWIKWHNQRHRRAHGVDRIACHFTPTSSSRMNLVERFFRDLTVDVVRDGSFASVADLAEAINGYLAEHNLNPKRYVWRKSGEQILASIQRAVAGAAHRPPGGGCTRLCGGDPGCSCGERGRRGGDLRRRAAPCGDGLRAHRAGGGRPGGRPARLDVRREAGRGARPDLRRLRPAISGTAACSWSMPRSP